jgi:hypothetical protein
MNLPEPLRIYGTACALRRDPFRSHQTSRPPKVLVTDLLNFVPAPTRCEVGHLHAWNAADERMPVSDLVKDGCFDAVALALLGIQHCGGHWLTNDEPRFIRERWLVAVDVPCWEQRRHGARPQERVQ